MKISLLAALLVASPTVLAAPGTPGEQAVSGWLSWRGPLQTGVSLERDLPEELSLDGPSLRWSFDLAGRGAPVIASGRVYTLGYEGEGPELEELVACLDAKTGALLWDRRWNDYLSDSIYSRYAIGSPTVDPETGDVFVLTTAGRFLAFSRDGAPLWEHSMMEEFGRLTFPNGRTGSPIVDGDLVIVCIINAHWGGTEGPARNRFYAFDKRTGRHVWTSTPGVQPIDGPFSCPMLEWRGGHRLLYAGTGCGNVVCIDALTGDPVWRYQFAAGGVNTSPMVHGDDLIVVHGRENLDSSTIGRMVALKLGAYPTGDQPRPLVLDAGAERWRNELVSFTSSPVLVGDRVYLTDQTGELCCVDAGTGRILWHHKLATDQIHASPAAGDGKLYVPMNDGTFHVVRPSDEGPEVLSSVQLEGNCLGAASICDGDVYVHTTAKLYCFGSGEGEFVDAPAAAAGPAPLGEPARLLIVPGDVLLRPGDETGPYEVRLVDANGRALMADVPGAGYEAPAQLGLRFDTESGMLFAPADAKPGVGVLKVTAGGLTATARVRVVPAPGYAYDFEDIALTQTHGGENAVPYAFPPGHWVGSRLKWDVVERDGNKMLAKTLDVPLFQRSMGFIGHPDDRDYTVRVDIMTDGNRRTMSNAGVICQRYLVELKGNHQELEISSNVERLKVTTPFAWKPGEWCTLEARVDRDEDGSGVVRARVWKRDEPRPDAWTLEVPLAHVHESGAPGIFSFAPQSRFSVYLDNLSVTPNE